MNAGDLRALADFIDHVEAECDVDVERYAVDPEPVGPVTAKLTVSIPVVEDVDDTSAHLDEPAPAADDPPEPPVVDAGTPAIVEAAAEVDIPERPDDEHDAGEREDDEPDTEVATEDDQDVDDAPDIAPPDEQEFATLSSDEKRELIVELLRDEVPVEGVTAAELADETLFGSRQMGIYLGQLSKSGPDDLVIEREKVTSGPAKWHVHLDGEDDCGESDSSEGDTPEDESVTEVDAPTVDVDEVEAAVEPVTDESSDDDQPAGRSADLPDGLTDGDVHAVADLYETIEDVAADFDVSEERAYAILVHYGLAEKVRVDDDIRFSAVEYPEGVTREDVREIATTGKHLHVVADELGVSTAEARGIVSKAGVYDRITEGKPKSRRRPGGESA